MKMIINELDDLISEIGKPLSSAELTNGWTLECQASTLLLLEQARDTIRRGGALPDLNLGRGLDHWGVVEGPLLEKACRISNHLRELNGDL